ncbi:MAG: hypothetical protein WBW47_00495 [Thermoplasmata archaeon]
MAEKRYSLQAQVSTDNPTAVRPVLARLIPTGSVTAGGKEGEFRVAAEMEGTSARDLNRFLLSELRRAEKKTRLRAEWTSEGITERFFDYVPKGTHKA